MLYQIQTMFRHKPSHRQKHKFSTKQRGFTLVELLVALVVMAIMAALSWRGLDVMLRSREITQARVDEVASLENVIRQWDSDLDAVFPVTTSGGAPGLYSNSNAGSGPGPGAGAGVGVGAGTSTTTPASPTPLPTLTAAPLNSSSTPKVMAIDWDGRVLRVVRRSSTPKAQGLDGGLNVVGWTMRDNAWVRWQSPDLLKTADLIKAWNEVSLWAQNSSSESKQYETILFSSSGWQIYYFRDNAWSNPLSSSGAQVNSSNNPSALSAIPDGIRIEVQLPERLGGAIVKDWVRPSFSINRS